MRKYGDVAIMAARLLQQQNGMHPEKAWSQAALEVFPDSESSRKKGCPRNAFLGLCEEGVVKNIQSGNYTQSAKNKKYALAALSLLKNDPALANNKAALWYKVQNGSKKQHNAQMDVVVSLWEDSLLD